MLELIIVADLEENSGLETEVKAESADAISISTRTWDCPRIPQSNKTVRTEEVARGENFKSYINKLWVAAEELRGKQSWLVWLSWLGAVPQIERSQVQFPVRAHAWVVGSVPGWDA